MKKLIYLLTIILILFTSGFFCRYNRYKNNQTNNNFIKNLDPKIKEKIIGEWLTSPIATAEYPGSFIFYENGTFEFKNSEIPYIPDKKSCDIIKPGEIHNIKEYSGKYDIDLFNGIIILNEINNEKKIKIKKLKISNIEIESFGYVKKKIIYIDDVKYYKTGWE